MDAAATTGKAGAVFPVALVALETAIAAVRVTEAIHGISGRTPTGRLGHSTAQAESGNSGAVGDHLGAALELL